MNKFLFIDCDGTLLTSDDKVSDLNKTAIKKALDRGYEVVLLSGRPYLFVKYLANSIDHRLQAIGFNGAYNEKGFDLSLSAQQCNGVVSAIKPYSNKILLKSLTKIYAIDKMIKYFSYIIEDGKEVDFVEYCSLDEVLKDKIYKVIAVMPVPIARELKDQLLGFNCKVVEYSQGGIEITTDKTDKAIAATHLINSAKQDVKDCYFFGDNMNDLSMFNCGGVNIAMANACQEIKDKANYITLSNDEDGVGLAIEKILKGEI